MDITLQDGRKATLLGQVTDKMSKIRLEDGRETLWPTAKIPQQAKEGEDTLKLVVVPAIDRLRELEGDCEFLFKSVPTGSDDDIKSLQDLKNAAIELIKQLREEAIKEFKHKWGLT